MVLKQADNVQHPQASPEQPSLEQLFCEAREGHAKIIRHWFRIQEMLKQRGLGISVSARKEEFHVTFKDEGSVYCAGSLYDVERFLKEDRAQTDQSSPPPRGRWIGRGPSFFFRRRIILSFSKRQVKNGH